MYLFMFAAAAILAVLGIITVFKINLDKVKENPEQIEKAQTNFFIGTAVSEAIPLILIIFAFANTEPVAIEEIYIPAFIVILTMVVGTIFIFLQRKIDVAEENKQEVNRLSMLALPMTNAIPIIALVMMFINIG